MPNGWPRRYMQAPLQMLRAQPRPQPTARMPVPGDIPALATLMLAAYRGSIDDEGEGPAECLAEIEKTFQGEYGAFNAECSRVVERDARIVSAVLVTRWQDRPFIAFTMTESASMREGLARQCMLGAMAALQRAGEHELRLVVTLANTPALALYESLGFVVQD